jgi:acetate kinase
MDGQLLTLNAGSSSVKFALFAPDADELPATFTGQIDGLGVAARLTVRDERDALADVVALGGTDVCFDHDRAIDAVLAWVAKRAGRVAAVGHRIVHGGTRFVGPVRIDDEAVAAMTALVPLAPLHQPHNIAGVRAARRAFERIPQVACFDTAFHASQPELNRRFALPRALFDAGLRRYGFHGLSYESIASQLAKAGDAAAHGRVVIAHLGNGASMCAMRDLRSVATTMSFSPLDGLPMGTRCGRLDAAVVLNLLQDGTRSADDVSRLLFRESGLLGLSGVSSDMRDLEASGASDAAMAIDYFVEHALRELAGMVAALRGIDLLVFTGGIGENAVTIRQRIIDGAAWMKIPDVRVLRTNEEAMIARHTAAFA